MKEANSHNDMNEILDQYQNNMETKQYNDLVQKVVCGNKAAISEFNNLPIDEIRKHNGWPWIKTDECLPHNNQSVIISLTPYDMRLGTFETVDTWNRPNVFTAQGCHEATSVPYWMPAPISPIAKHEIMKIFYKIQFINFNHNDGDYDICKTIDALSEILNDIAPILDSDSICEFNSPYSVVISPIVMSDIEFDKFINEKSDPTN